MRKDWIEAVISDLCEINPKLKNKESISPEFEVQFLPMALVEEVSNKIYLLETRKFSEVQKKSYTYFSEGDVLFAKVTPCMENGKIAVAKGLKNQMGYGSSEFHVLRPSKAINDKLLFYFLVQSRFRNEAQHNMTGAVGLRRVPKQFIENHSFPLPPLPEQRAIVARIEELFSELDHSISNLKSAQAKLEIYRQAVLKKAFEGGFTERSIAFRNVELKNVVKKISDGPFGSNLKTADYTNEGVRVIRLENIGINQFRDEFRTFVSNEKYESIKNHTVGNGDIIFSSFISEMVRAVILPSQIVKAINKADCFLIRVDEVLIRRKYLTYYFLTKHFYNQLVDQVHGATRPRINTTQLKASIIPFCELLEQDFIIQEIESRLSVADKMAETIQTSLQKAEALRQSILKKAFDGKLLTESELEVCRKESDWEPAERLLERIEKGIIKK